MTAVLRSIRRGRGPGTGMDGHGQPRANRPFFPENGRRCANFLITGCRRRRIAPDPRKIVESRDPNGPFARRSERSWRGFARFERRRRCDGIQRELPLTSTLPMRSTRGGAASASARGRENEMQVLTDFCAPPRELPAAALLAEPERAPAGGTDLIADAPRPGTSEAW